MLRGTREGADHVTHVVAGPDLLGREDERRRLHQLVGHARNGRGGALLLVGDPGIGKTTLLRAATDHLPGEQVLRLAGFEAESTMPFAAVERLLRPLRDHLTALPARHLQALRVASGEAAGPPPDRFLVGLGILGLLAVAGGERPVVVVVDDAHLLDPESLDALAFVARRLEAESAALLMAGRSDPDFEARTAGVDLLLLGGLDQETAVRLLARSLPEPIDPPVALQIAAATGGNPLALVDLAHELTVKQLTESSFGDEPVPIGRHLEAFYLRQVRLLDPGGQLWLLVAAADSTGNLDLIEAAARELELDAAAGEAAESSGLIELGRDVRFRHPLVKSAAYNAAPGKDRRRVHRALSVIAEKMGLRELEAWHAAKATLGTDEEVAQRLELVADLAAERGGFASRARVLTQASALTPEGARKYARLVRAAEAALAAGTAQLAKNLVDEVDEELLDPVSRGRLISLGADYAMFTAAPGLVRAGADKLDAAALFHGEDPELEQSALMRAWDWSLPAERLATGTTWTELGERLRAGAEVRKGHAATILRAVSALILLPYAEAVPVIRAALDAYEAMDDEDMLAYGQGSVALSTALWDDGARHRLLQRWADVARDTGSLQQLDGALWVLSLAEAMGGTPRRAQHYMEQVRELRRAIGYDAEHVVNVAVLAWSSATRGQVLDIAAMIQAMGFGGVHSSAMATLATVDIAEGAYDAAYEKLKPLVDDPFFHLSALPYPDFVEAALRTGRVEEAAEVLGRLEAVAEANRAGWALGAAARVRALMAPDGEAEQHFLQAIEHLQRTSVSIELGRAHLGYGEWLRRCRRRADAATQLSIAEDLFARAGAEPFTDRAQRELRATGGTAAAGPDGATPALTAQEQTVAELAASGHTNAEIGATMFLSPNTVDYHLRKVFQKLGISSRRQLADRLPD